MDRSGFATVTCRLTLCVHKDDAAKVSLLLPLTLVETPASNVLHIVDGKLPI